MEGGEEHELWMMFMDGSVNSEGSGVEIILTLPQGEETKLVMQHQESNNEAEYEALLIRLRVTQNVGVTRVLMHLDSQLVVQ